MKVRVDTYIGENGRFDTDFLSRRRHWLPYTGIYLEFILKGGFDQQIDFKVTTKKDKILVSRHSWNRFFLNLQDSGSVEFELLASGKSLFKKIVQFDVVSTDVPLMFTFSSLLQYSITDIRFFANRLSENVVNSTRLTLFSPKHLENLTAVGFDAQKYLTWNVYELIFSILTERGLVVFISPFDSQVIYSLTHVKKLKEVLLQYIEKWKKFRIVWDLSSGLRKRELGGIVDSILGHFDRELSIMLSKDMYDKIGGEGFCYGVKTFKQKDSFPRNERGIKVARLMKTAGLDFFALRKFTQKAVAAGWGVEVVFPEEDMNLRKMRYSLSRALYRGFSDVREVVNK